MAIDLAVLATNVAKLTVEYGTQEIEISYHPGVATPTRIKQASEGDDEIAPFIKFVVELVHTWDLVNDGVPLPVTVEAAGTVPMTILQKIMQACLSDSQNVGEAVSPSSDG